MKVNRFFTVVALVLMLIGGSYAYWQQSLEINSTISCGDLSLDITPGIPVSSNYVTASAEDIADASAIDLTISGMYPQSYAVVPITVHNSGSLGAVLKDFSITPVLPSDYGTYGDRQKADYRALDEHIAIYIKEDSAVAQRGLLTGEPLSDGAISELGYQTADQFVDWQVAIDQLIDVENGSGKSQRDYKLLFVFDEAGALGLGELSNMQMRYTLCFTYQQFNALD